MSNTEEKDASSEVQSRERQRVLSAAAKKRMETGGTSLRTFSFDGILNCC